MNHEQQPVAAPSAAEFLEICAQFLTVAEKLYSVAEEQSEEIRHLISQAKIGRM
jgi:hypothetical protein